MQISINGDERVIQLSSNMRGFFRNPKQALKKSGNLLVDEFDKQFQTEGSRLGRKWKPLAASTITQRARLGFGSGPILQRTGKLRRGFEQDLKRYSVRVHNPVEYFKYHQTGGRKLPKRQMIASPERLKQEVVSIVIDELRKFTR